MQQTDTATCRRKLWWLAAVGAVLAWLGLWLLAHWAFFAALVTGALFGAVAGLLLSWAFCTGSAGTTVAAAPASRPAPHPAPPPQPAPNATPTPTQTSVRTPAAAPELRATPQTSPQTAAPPAFATMTDTGAPRAEAPAAPPPVRAAEPAPAEEPQPARKRKASALETAMERSREPGVAETELLTAPRAGQADDLKLIKGVGPVLEAMLNDIGIWHFDQIAAWKARDIAFVDGRLHGFKGRITRDGWVAQARELMQGNGATEGKGGGKKA